VAPSPRNSWIVTFSRVLDVERTRGTKLTCAIVGWRKALNEWSWPDVRDIATLKPTSFGLQNDLGLLGDVSASYPLQHIDALNDAFDKNPAGTVDPSKGPSACCHVAHGNMRIACPVRGECAFCVFFSTKCSD
jgi:hypothetical protein